MGVGFNPVKQATRIQVFCDQWIGILHEFAAPRAYIRDEGAVFSNCLQDRQVKFKCSIHVLRTKSRRHVYQSGAVLRGNKIPENHIVRRFFQCQEGKQWLIFDTFQLLAFEGLKNLHIFIPEHLFNQFFRQDQFFCTAICQLSFDDHIVHVRVCGNSHITRQGPGCRRPYQQRGPRIIDQRQANKYGWIHSLAVSLGYFVVGEWCTAAWAVRHNLETLVKQILVPESFQDPPHRFDVVICIGDVGFLQINPESDPVRQPLPFLDIVKRRLTAKFVERPDTILLDLALAVEAQALLNFYLNWQSVSIPTPTTDDMLALHRVIARENIFKCPGKHMVNAWNTICCRWSFVEYIFRVPAPLFLALFEDVANLPHAQNGFFHLGDIKIW